MSDLTANERILEALQGIRAELKRQTELLEQPRTIVNNYAATDVVNKQECTCDGVTSGCSLCGQLPPFMAV